MEWLDKAIRDAGGYAAVADEVGCTQPYLYMLVHRRRRMSGDMARRLQAVMPGIDSALWMAAMTQPIEPRKAAST